LILKGITEPVDAARAAEEGMMKLLFPAIGGAAVARYPALLHFRLCAT